MREVVGLVNLVSKNISELKEKKKKQLPYSSNAQFKPTIGQNSQLFYLSFDKIFNLFCRSILI